MWSLPTPQSPCTFVRFAPTSLASQAVLKKSFVRRTSPALTLPVRYKGDDLTRVAAHCGLTTEDVVALHTRSVYTVAVIGFLPHFPYLVGLDEKLTTPRLEAPRTRVPAGSVAIGGNQTGVYPADSPGGWNIIGDTDPSLLETLAPGDRVVFRERS